MVNSNIFPCFWFNGNAKEAADFYTSIFPNTLTTVSTPIVVNIELSGQKLMFLNGGPQFQPNPTISLMVMCSSADEVDSYYQKLSAGGTVMMALDSYPWSEKYAWVQDKFGISWQLYQGDKINQKYIPTLMYVNQNNGKCQDAIELYTKIFPQSTIDSIMHYPEEATADAGNIAHAQFSINNFTMMAMDSSYEHQFNFTEGVSFVVMTTDQQETDQYWEALTMDGGQESMCGWLKDKYGVSWQIVPHRLITLMNDPNHEKAQQVVEAMLSMRKIVISDLEKAFKN